MDGMNQMMCEFMKETSRRLCVIAQTRAQKSAITMNKSTNEYRAKPGHMNLQTIPENVSYNPPI